MSRKAWRTSTRAARLPSDWRRIRRFVLERDGHVCQIRLPGCTLQANEVDHVDAADDNDPSNLQAACVWCNQRKNIATRARPARKRRPSEAHPGLTQDS